MTSAMTVAAWVRRTQAGFDGIVAKNPSTGSGNNHPGNYEIRLSNGTPQFFYERTTAGPNDIVGGSGTTDVPLDEWTHFAITADGTTARFYIDGAPAGTFAMVAGFGETNTNPFLIGTRADITTIPFNGFLDDVAIFDGALTQQEIQQISTGDFSAFIQIVPEPTSVALWSLLGIALVGGARWHSKKMRRHSAY